MSCFVLSPLPQVLPHHVLSSSPHSHLWRHGLRHDGELRRGFKEEHLGKWKKRKGMSFFSPCQSSDHLFVFTCCSSCFLSPLIESGCLFLALWAFYMCAVFICLFIYLFTCFFIHWRLAFCYFTSLFLTPFCWGLKHVDLVVEERKRLIRLWPVLKPRIRITWITCYMFNMTIL